MWTGRVWKPKTTGLHEQNHSCKNMWKRIFCCFSIRWLPLVNAMHACLRGVYFWKRTPPLRSSGIFCFWTPPLRSSPLSKGTFTNQEVLYNLFFCCKDIKLCNLLFNEQIHALSKSPLFLLPLHLERAGVRSGSVRRRRTRGCFLYSTNSSFSLFNINNNRTIIETFFR